MVYRSISVSPAVSNIPRLQNKIEIIYILSQFQGHWVVYFVFIKLVKQHVDMHQYQTT